MDDVSTLRRPQFIYIGAAKAASSWLHEIMLEHPEIFVPTAKDLQFFDHHFDLGLEWYLSHFKKSGTSQVVGEISHDYFLSEIFAQRIYEACPDVKLLVCLREPLDLTVSWYVYGRSVFVGKDVSLDEFAFWPDTMKGCDYFHNLQPFYERFGSERIKVMFFDDLKNDPLKFAQEIFQFIGVDSLFVPPSHKKPARASRIARWEWLGHTTWMIAKFLRSIGFASVVGAVKRHALFNRVLFRSNPHKPVYTDQIREKLKLHYQKDYEILEKMIGRELPKSWVSGKP